MTTTDQTTPAPADPVFRRIPRSQLHRSPTQPRLVYPEAYIAALAADIKSHGRNLQPLLVRPRVPELFKGTGDPDAVAGYEVVFGSCREMACGIAGVEEPWCEIRDMTDQEAERAQISENLQRKDVHPFEEAQSYQSLIERHGDTADAIAERTGKSRSYIYGRLKLLQACPEIRKACLDGEISAEVALLIARLRTDKLQGKALARIKAKYWKLEDGGQASFRQIRDLLKEEFTLNLKGAIFDPCDAELLPSAGVCTTCPKRSSNAPEFEDLLQSRKDAWRGNVPGDPNLCTDPDCFAAKKAAHLKAVAAKHREAGREVIEGNRARTLVSATGEIKGGYLPLAKVKEELKRARANVERDSKLTNAKLQMPVAVLIQDPRSGKTFEAVKESDLVAAGTRQAAPEPSKGGSSSDRRQEDYEAQRLKDDAAATKLTEKRTRWLHLVRDAARAAPRSTFDMRLVIGRLLELLDEYPERSTLKQVYGIERFDELTDRVETMTADELGLLLLDCALARWVEVDRWELDEEPTALLAAAKHYGVELVDEPAPTPSKAARAQEEGGDDVDEDSGAAAADTASTAALAPSTSTSKPAAALTPQTAWPFPNHPPAAKTKSQAGSAGKVAKGAGSAGVSSSTTPAAAGGVAASRGLLDEVMG